MTRLVRDRVTHNGVLIEDTLDWFAQSASGDVWYLGEQTCEYEGGVCVDTGGSFEAGVDGAKAGIVMPARPSGRRTTRSATSARLRTAPRFSRRRRA